MADQDAEETETTIVLEGNVDIKATQSLLDQLKAAAMSAPLVLDVSKVEQMSTPATLAILSCINSRPDDAPKLAILGAPPAFVDAFSTLGFFQDVMKMEFR